MSKTKVVNFAVVIDGTPRCVLSVIEKSSGDLILSLRSSGLVREHGTPIQATATNPLSMHGAGIFEHRISVHRSEKSVLKISTIKLTSILESGEELTLVHYTSAVKKNMFALLYARRCSTLDDKEHDVSNTAQFISLGNGHRMATLVFAVFVGPSDKRFAYSTANCDFAFIQEKFSTFSIVIVYSFLAFPAHESGSLFHVQSVNVQSVPEQAEGSVLDENGCISQFIRLREHFQSELATVINKDPHVTNLLILALSAVYMQDVKKYAEFISTLPSS